MNLLLDEHVYPVNAIGGHLVFQVAHPLVRPGQLLGQILDLPVERLRVVVLRRPDQLDAPLVLRLGLALRHTERADLSRAVLVLALELKEALLQLRVPLHELAKLKRSSASHSRALFELERKPASSAASMPFCCWVASSRSRSSSASCALISRLPFLDASCSRSSSISSLSSAMLVSAPSCLARSDFSCTIRSVSSMCSGTGPSAGGHSCGGSERCASSSLLSCSILASSAFSWVACSVRICSSCRFDLATCCSSSSDRSVLIWFATCSFFFTVYSSCRSSSFSALSLSIAQRDAHQCDLQTNDCYHYCCYDDDYYYYYYHYKYYYCCSIMVRIAARNTPLEYGSWKLVSVQMAAVTENGGVSLSDRICRMRTSSYAMVKMLFLSAILFRLPLVWSSEFIAMPESWSSSSVDTLSVFAFLVLVPPPPPFDFAPGAAVAAAAAAADWSTILICTLLSRLTIGGVSGLSGGAGTTGGPVPYSASNRCSECWSSGWLPPASCCCCCCCWDWVTLRACCMSSLSRRASFGGLVRGAGSGLPLAGGAAAASPSPFRRLPPVVMVVVELVVVVVSSVVPPAGSRSLLRPSRFSSESPSLLRL
uniref:Uncharacterized protein n=1 Tax=Anopheles merus TaxID=30066 RepID=A0A182UQ43_ANOME